MIGGGSLVRRVGLVGLLCLTTLFVFVLATSGESAAASMTFTVNSTGDTPDATVGDGVCADATGACTLRAAIQESNASGDKDTIGFAIPSAPLTIAPATVLPGDLGPGSHRRHDTDRMGRRPHRRASRAGRLGSEDHGRQDHRSWPRDQRLRQRAVARRRGRQSHRGKLHRHRCHGRAGRRRRGPRRPADRRLQ